MNRIPNRIGLPLLLAVLLAALVAPAHARVKETDPEYQDLQILKAEWEARLGGGVSAKGKPSASPAAIPDIFNSGAVLNVGNVFMKVTNNGLVGNPFTNISSDPSCQWPGASGVEYMNFVGLAVGAVNPLATDPNAIRRVSYLQEWRPATLDPEDRIYRGYDGIIGGQRFINDDTDRDPATGDALIDEDFLDGRDNDGDGRIDEDFAALGQQMYSCVIRDDTPQAIQAAATERHVPLGLEARQSAWAYSIDGYTDFNVVQWDIYNRSGHVLDSVYIGLRTDMDCGPLEKGNYFSDDFNLPTYPQGDFWVKTGSDDGRLQPPSKHANVGQALADSNLCSRFKIRIQGWSTADDDNDENKTPGVGSVLLIDHSTDPTGQSGPTRVGFRAFRSFPGGTPYTQGGSPTIDQQRYEFMSNKVAQDPNDLRVWYGENVDPLTGFINLPAGDQKGDFSEWAAVGPWLNLADGGRISITVAIGVQPGDFKTGNLQRYLAELQKVADPNTGIVSDGTSLMIEYPGLANAFAAQVAFSGKYDETPWPVLPDAHGREYCVKAPPGQFFTLSGCFDRDPSPRLVGDRQFECFDMDCDYCTGAYDYLKKLGLFHRTWLAAAPPPSPSTNLSVSYNYTDNPDRKFPPAGDGKVTVAWDNLSETTVDPKSGQFDFRGYRLWKVSNWQRPVGAGGPSEDDWTLLAEYRIFDYAASNRSVGQCPPESVQAGNCSVADTLCPLIFIPQKDRFERVCLKYGDLFDVQSGDVIRPDPSVLCKGWPDCEVSLGWNNGQSTGDRVPRTKYPVGRYRYLDRSVKNGFVYFYSVTAFDSTAGQPLFYSRRSAVEAEGVVPQIAADTHGGGKKVWVVPNPYRGARFIQDRPSAWDLTPNATDPTGTHVDFFGLPPGTWRIKIFTVSGDLVDEINSTDAVNESVRGEATASDGVKRPGFNRQQDTADDGQARWNLISRNGQDVVSGIYLFTVETGGSVVHRGKFVIIR